MATKLKIYIYIIFITGIFSQCSYTYHDKGTMYKELAYPQGRGTLIIFFTEDDNLSEKIKIDVGLLSENYNQELQIYLIDVLEKRNLVEKHRIEQIPTLLLFDNLGREVYRWLPWDFRSDFGSHDIERKIETLPPPVLN
jgi:thioredoxin-related protein